MKLGLTCLLVALCWTPAAFGQNGSPIAQSLVGCYELRTTKWNPPLEDDPRLSLFPSRLRLAVRSEDSKTILAVESVPQIPNRSIDEKLWFWSPEGNGLRLSFGTGLGGYRGRLKRVKDGEYSGRLKQWCDNRCEYK